MSDSRLDRYKHSWGGGVSRLAGPIALGCASTATVADQPTCFVHLMFRSVMLLSRPPLAAAAPAVPPATGTAAGLTHLLFPATTGGFRQRRCASRCSSYGSSGGFAGSGNQLCSAAATDRFRAGANGRNPLGR